MQFLSLSRPKLASVTYTSSLYVPLLKLPFGYVFDCHFPIALAFQKPHKLQYNDFTSDVDSFKSKLVKLEAQGVSNSFDMLSVFNVLDQTAAVEIFGSSKPNFVYRLIFLYSRSTVLPQPQTYAKNDVRIKLTHLNITLS